MNDSQDLSIIQVTIGIQISVNFDFQPFFLRSVLSQDYRGRLTDFRFLKVFELRHS